MTYISDGPKALFSGFKLLTQKGIRRFVLLPLLLNTLLFASILYFGMNSLDDMISWLTSNYPWTAWLSWLLWPLFALVSLAIVFFCFSIVANLLAAPFNGFLAEAVARHLGDVSQIGNLQKTPLSQELLKAFKSEANKLLYFIVRAAPLLLLFFIPVIQAIAPIIWFIFGAWMLSLEYMEYPMGNKGLLFPEVRSKVSEQRLLTLSFGSSVMLMTMIPLVNFLVMPAAVAAATKIYFDNYKADSKVIENVAK